MNWSSHESKNIRFAYRNEHLLGSIFQRKDGSWYWCITALGSSVLNRKGSTKTEKQAMACFEDAWDQFLKLYRIKEL